MKLRWLAGLLLFCLLSVPVSAQEKITPLSLDECIKIALENNLTINTYRHLAEISDNNIKASYAWVLPSIGVSASASRFKSGDATIQSDVPIIGPDGNIIGFENQEVTNPGFSRNSYSAGLNAGMTLFDGGNWWNQIKKAKVDNDLANQDLDARINQIIKSVAQSYFDLLKQQKLLEVNDVAIKRSEENLDRSTKMFEIGSVAKIDLFRARVNLGNDKIALIQQRNLTSSSRYLLNILMGYDPKNELQLEEADQAAYSIRSLEELLHTAANNHPDIRRLELDARSRELTVSIAKSSFVPSIGGFFNYNRNNTDLSKLYSDLDQNWSYSVGLSASYNIFNGFQDQTNVQNAKVALKNAQIALAEFKLNLESTIRSLYQTYQDLQEIVTINRDNLEASREEYRLATERYRLGSGTSLDVREAQVNLTEAERILVTAQYDLIINYIELQEAIGQVQQIYQ